MFFYLQEGGPNQEKGSKFSSRVAISILQTSQRGPFRVLGDGVAPKRARHIAATSACWRNQGRQALTYQQQGFEHAAIRAHRQRQDPPRPPTPDEKSAEPHQCRTNPTTKPTRQLHQTVLRPLLVELEVRCWCRLRGVGPAGSLRDLSSTENQAT